MGDHFQVLKVSEGACTVSVSIYIYIYVYIYKCIYKYVYICSYMGYRIPQFSFVTGALESPWPVRNMCVYVIISYYILPLAE